MVMSKEQREEHSYRMWCHWYQKELTKIMNNPELKAKVDELFEKWEKEEKGQKGG